jgi:hypothetical protein
VGGRSGQGRQEAAQEEVGLCTPHPTKKRTRLGWPKPICISSFRPKLTSASFPLYQHPPPPLFLNSGGVLKAAMEALRELERVQRVLSLMSSRGLCETGSSGGGGAADRFLAQFLLFMVRPPRSLRPSSSVSTDSLHSDVDAICARAACLANVVALMALPRLWLGHMTRKGLCANELFVFNF